MSNEFQNILLVEGQDDFNAKLLLLRGSIASAAAFRLGDERRQAVLEILTDVAKNGAEALVNLTEKYDGVKLTPDQLQISQADMKKAHEETDAELMATIRKSIANVRKYQEEIFTGKSIDGKVKYTPIERVGVCVPGASAPLPSTVIMTVVPAQVAGVKEIAIMSPPRFEGGIHPVTLAVCYELGVNEVYRIGGAQGVAALASGIWTKTDGQLEPIIPSVDKIVGPGNQWVQTAKQLFFGTVGIDSIAGPSEVLIIADDSANPAWVAADMLSQAEHAPGSAIVLTQSKALAEGILGELSIQIEKLDRAQGTKECLKKYSGIAVFNDFETVINCANSFAAEHLQIQCGKKSRDIADKINNAGAIFIGDYSPVAVGDYWAGPSHTLPTGMNARFASALSSNDFVKATSIIEYDKKKLEGSADDIIRLATVEGLDAHAKSVQIRRG